MSNKNTKKEINYPVIELEKHGKLILPDSILTQINYLHGKVGKEEWSGMLVYDVISGNPGKPEDFKLEAKHIFLMDIGTAAYTEYEPDGDIVDIYDNIPEAMEWKTGHIHTHHTMETFFSSTDMGELNSNVDKHNYYLSLIVNFSGRFSAKVAFLSDVQNSSKLNFIDDSGKKQSFETGQAIKTMVVINMDIYYKMKDNFFFDRYDQVIEKIKEAKKIAEKNKRTKYQSHYGSVNSNLGFRQSSALGSEDDNSYPTLNSRVLNSKGASDTTDPKNMQDTEVDVLTRNVISVTPDMNEQRSIYSILYFLSNAKKAELEYYYTYLADNIETIISNFFDQTIESEEMDIVLDEISSAMLMFQTMPAIGGIVKAICEVLTLFGLAYRTLENDEGFAETLEDEAIEIL